MRRSVRRSSCAKEREGEIERERGSCTLLHLDLPLSKKIERERGIQYKEDVESGRAMSRR